MSMAPLSLFDEELEALGGKQEGVLAAAGRGLMTGDEAGRAHGLTIAGRGALQASGVDLIHCGYRSQSQRETRWLRVGRRRVISVGNRIDGVWDGRPGGVHATTGWMLCVALLVGGAASAQTSLSTSLRLSWGSTRT